MKKSRAAVAASGAGGPPLASEMAEIEGQRQRLHQAARDEEYVGFTELHTGELTRVVTRLVTSHRSYTRLVIEHTNTRLVTHKYEARIRGS